MAQKTFFIVFQWAFIEVTKKNFGESPILTETHSPYKIRRSYDSQKERVMYNYNIKLTKWLFFSKEICLDSLKYQ